MTVLAFAINTAEQLPLSDRVTLAGIKYMCGRSKRQLDAITAEEERAFVEAMNDFPIAMHVNEAKRQHFEMPPQFFAYILGPRRKYSACYHPNADSTLEEAELYSLEEIVERADIHDGMDILELGCGWGAISLYLAEQFPNSRITTVSNSVSQYDCITSLMQERGITNVTVITADMNDFTTQNRFDRVVSVEMFEHMANWRRLLERVRSWMKPNGKLFIHMFTHRDRSYRFDHNDPTDWIAQYFFTGGMMPARDLPYKYGDLFKVEQEWRMNGAHYRRTALGWLANYDRKLDRIQPILQEVYGKDAAIWQRRWRLFFLATAGMFGHEDGEVWSIGHYLLSPA